MTVTVNTMKDDIKHTPAWGYSIFTTDDHSTSAKNVGTPEQKPLKKRVSQSNHDSYVIPPSLSGYAQEPLYILIALWCQAQARWVDRNDISEVFHLTARRASYQMSYISCKNETITCRIRRVACEGQRRRRNEMYVESVTLVKKTSESSDLTQAEQKSESGPPKKKGRRGGGGDNASRCRWPLSRSSGEDK